MIIDFHVHIFPDKIAQSAIANLSEKSKLPPYTNGTIKDTVIKMDEAKIDKSVICNIATNPKQMHNVNSFALEQAKNGRLVPFGSIYPKSDYISELDRLKDCGIKGIKLHPDYQDFFIDESGMQKVYEDILKRDFILIFHAGVDYGVGEPTHATPKRTKNVIEMFRGEKVVLAHMGGFDMWDDDLNYLMGEDIYIDTSCSNSFADKDTILKLLNAHKREKILFATDTPWNDMKKEIEATYNLGLDDDFTQMILYKNAAKLLEI